MRDCFIAIGCIGIVMAGIAAFLIRNMWYNLGLAIFCLFWCWLVWQLCGRDRGVREKKEGLWILTPAFYVNTLVAVATGMGIIWVWLQA